MDAPDTMSSREPAPARDFDRLLEAMLPSLVSQAAQQEKGRVYRFVIGRVELPLLRHALDLSGGNQLRAAGLLGINRNTLRKRLRLLGLLPSSRGNGPDPL